MKKYFLSKIGILLVSVSTLSVSGVMAMESTEQGKSTGASFMDVEKIFLSMAEILTSDLRDAFRIAFEFWEKEEKNCFHDAKYKFDVPEIKNKFEANWKNILDFLLHGETTLKPFVIPENRPEGEALLEDFKVAMEVIKLYFIFSIKSKGYDERAVHELLSPHVTSMAKKHTNLFNKPLFSFNCSNYLEVSTIRQENEVEGTESELRNRKKFCGKVKRLHTYDKDYSPY